MGVCGVYIPPKNSVQVKFLWGKNDARTAIEHEYLSFIPPQKLLYPTKQSSGYVPGPHLENMTSYQKSDSVSRCVFTWQTIMPNFIVIRFDTTELELF